MAQFPALFHLQDQARRNAGEALRTVRLERARSAPGATAPVPVPVSRMQPRLRPDAPQK